MAKAWDIIGIKKQAKKPTSSSTPRKRSRQNCSFWLILILAFLGAILLFGKLTQKGFILPEGKASVIPSSTSTPSPKVTTKKIQILNGSGRFEESAKVTKLISDAGYTVSKTGTSLNTYDKTIVYYKSGMEGDANKIASALATYNAKTQAFSTDSSYDLSIIIGTK